MLGRSGICLGQNRIPIWPRQIPDLPRFLSGLRHIYTIYDINQARHKKKKFRQGLRPGCTATEARGLKFWICEVRFVCVEV